MEYLYGIKSSSLDAAEKAIAGLTGLAFTLHESSFRGGDYYLHRSDQFKEVILQRNFDDVEGEWFEQEFSDFPFIVYWYYSSPELAEKTTDTLLVDMRINLLVKKNEPKSQP